MSHGHGYSTDNQGKMVAKHRKVHLFDIDIPGKQTFKVCHFCYRRQELTDRNPIH
jgi:predicted amidohydrolase